MEAVFIKIFAAHVPFTAFPEDVRQLAGGGEVLEAGAAAGDELAADEDGGHHSVPRHRLHNVHHHLPVLALLVHFHTLELCAKVIKCPLKNNKINIRLFVIITIRRTLTLATVQ